MRNEPIPGGQGTTFDRESGRWYGVVVLPDLRHVYAERCADGSLGFMYWRSGAKAGAAVTALEADTDVAPNTTLAEYVDAHLCD